MVKGHLAGSGLYGHSLVSFHFLTGQSNFPISNKIFLFTGIFFSRGGVCIWCVQDILLLHPLLPRQCSVKIIIIIMEGSEMSDVRFEEIL